MPEKTCKSLDTRTASQARLCTGCVALSKLLDFSEPQFLHLYIGGESSCSTSFRGVLWKCLRGESGSCRLQTFPWISPLAGPPALLLGSNQTSCSHAPSWAEFISPFQPLLLRVLLTALQLSPRPVIPCPLCAAECWAQWWSSPHLQATVFALGVPDPGCAPSTG